MKIEQIDGDGVRVFRLTGRLDSTTSPGFETGVIKTIGPDASRVVLDFTAVDYVSSAGLRVVLMAAKQARAARGGFATFGMADPIRHVFDMSGFSKIIPVFGSMDDAVAAVQGA